MNEQKGNRKRYCEENVVIHLEMCEICSLCISKNSENTKCTTPGAWREVNLNLSTNLNL